MADLAVDICVVGAGSGGTSIAAAAAQLGRNVVLIDRGERGDHLRIASKALIAAARAAEAGRSGAEFGIAPATPEIDAKKLHAHIREIIVEVKAQNARVPFEGVKLIRDQAAFLDRKTLRSGDSRIRAKTFVLAAGTRAKIPDFADLESVPFFTTDTIFEKDVIPQHLIVLGGGSTGIELAQAHRRLGADVTVIDNARLLADYERPLAQIVLDQLLRDGIRLREGAKISRIDRSSVGVRVEIGRVQGAEIIEGSHLLVATGRAADVETLDLAKANVTCSERGIVVDKDLRTSNRRIYAIGDSVAAPQRVRGAHWHAAFLVRSLFAAQAAHGPHDALASVLHSDPEIATLGMSAAEAKAEKLTF